MNQQQRDRIAHLGRECEQALYQAHRLFARGDFQSAHELFADAEHNSRIAFKIATGGPDA